MEWKKEGAYRRGDAMESKGSVHDYFNIWLRN